MRDPGPPRRNPFFEHGSDGPLDDPGMGWRDPDAPEPTDPAEAGPSAFAALLAVVDGLGDAQPEAAEHLVAAAHEVVLAVKVLVDATEAALSEQRAAMVDRREADGAAGRGGVTDLAAVRRADGP
jgi:hypothetical protein